MAGTDHHQMTIMNIRFAINELARAAAGPIQPLPWQALSQTVLLGLRRPNGTAYKTLPDVFVYDKPIARQRGSVSPRRDGPPVLAIEVASESTFQADLNLQSGKGWSYGHAGAHEYVVLDPSGELFAERIRAWHLEDGVYVPHEPQTAEPWWSTEIPIGIAIEGEMGGVYDREHRRRLREGEGLETLAQKDAEIAALRRRLAQFGDR